MDCIETLARVDTLCVDKTGTITEPAMIVDDIVPLVPDRFCEDDIRSIMADYVSAMQSDNDTMIALKQYFDGTAPVSYTHLDVYKRQAERRAHVHDPAEARRTLERDELAGRARLCLQQPDILRVVQRPDGETPFLCRWAGGVVSQQYQYFVQLQLCQ